MASHHSTTPPTRHGSLNLDIPDDDDGHDQDEREPKLTDENLKHLALKAVSEPQRPPSSPRAQTFYSWNSPHVASERTEYLLLMLRILGVTILFMWAFLPLYWGSLASSAQHVGNLRAWFVNRDPGAIGSAVSNALSTAIQQNPSQAFGWQFLDKNDPRVINDSAVSSSVLRELTWVVLVVNENATQVLLSARSAGDESYNPSDVISVYYAQARNELATGNYIVPILTAFLTNATATIGNNLTAQFLSSADQASLRTAANAPQTVANPIAWTMFNIRPYTASVATAVTLVGEIYLCIFAFIITMANHNVRMPLQRVLKLEALIPIRIIVPMVFYIPLSLSFATISLPFKLPFDAKYAYAQGFFLYWFICYLTMSALGLATEAMITLLTPRFIAYFLLALIISNVSVASLPNELQPRIYRYGLGWPVFNASQSIRTIIFNTQSHLGRNIGALIAWIVLSIFTISLFTFLVIKKERGQRIRRGLE